MNGLEIIKYRDCGFEPVVIYHEWRVAILNYCDITEKKRLYRLERHAFTDEVFVLMNGNAYLLIGDEEGKFDRLDIIKMEKETVYNIKKNIWHHIIMNRSGSVLIVENADTGVHNTQYSDIPEEAVRRVTKEIHI